MADLSSCLYLLDSVVSKLDKLLHFRAFSSAKIHCKKCIISKVNFVVDHT
jgi:hypothetical protein